MPRFLVRTSTRTPEIMAETKPPTTKHLELLAQELKPYDTLDVRIDQRDHEPAQLQVASTTSTNMAETITCEAHSTSELASYRWSWGREIPGDSLTDKALSIAYVLNAAEPRQQICRHK
jgi:hypothetical protein